MYCFDGAARRVATSQFAKSLFSRIRLQKRVYPPLPPPPVRFGLKTGIHFAHFGLESGMVFEGTTGMYERISIVSIPNDR